MKPRALKMWMVVSLLTFFSSALAVPFALASSPGNAQKVDVAVMVSQKGFSDYRGKLFGDRNVLEVPKDAVVRITFVFDEKMTSLAYGDTHQFALAGHAEGSKESEKIWMFSKQSSITFQRGNAGDHYRAYCILDCIGMEHLINLVIRVV